MMSSVFNAELITFNGRFYLVWKIAHVHKIVNRGVSRKCTSDI